MKNTNTVLPVIEIEGGITTIYSDTEVYFTHEGNSYYIDFDGAMQTAIENELNGADLEQEHESRTEGINPEIYDYIVSHRDLWMLMDY